MLTGGQVFLIIICDERGSTHTVLLLRTTKYDDCLKEKYPWDCVASWARRMFHGIPFLFDRLVYLTNYGYSDLSTRQTFSQK